MGVCDIPQCEGGDSLPFTCNECGGTYCSKHRLPEAHHCQELRADNISWPVSNQQASQSPTSSSSTQALDTDSLPSAKTTSGGNRSAESQSESDHDAETSVSRPTQASDSKFRDPVKRWLGQIVGVALLPLIGAHYLLRSIWKRKLAVVAIVIGLLVSVAFGPVSLGAFIPGATADEVDSSLKALGNDTEQLFAEFTNDSNTVGQDGSAQSTQAPASGGEFDASRVEVLVHQRINDIRRNKGLPILNHHPELRRIASQYSKKMATEGFYGHTSPSGATFEDRYERAGFDCRVKINESWYSNGAENILYTFANTDVNADWGTVHFDTNRELARGIVKSWMQSPGHRKNILKEYWQNEGIGVYIIENPNGPGLKVYATQNFC